MPRERTEVLEVTLANPPAPPRVVETPRVREPSVAKKLPPPSVVPREQRTAKPATVIPPQAAARPEVLALPPTQKETPAFSVPQAEPAPVRAPDAEVAASPRQEAAKAGSAASSPSKGDGGDKSATITPPGFNAAYLRNPPPRYPVSARRNGEQGTVTLRVLVTREGGASTVSVDKTSGSTALDQAAVEAVRGWKFVPARQGAQAVEAWVLVPVVFRLEAGS